MKVFYMRPLDTANIGNCSTEKACWAISNQLCKKNIQIVHATDNMDKSFAELIKIMNTCDFFIFDITSMPKSFVDTYDSLKIQYMMIGYVVTRNVLPDTILFINKSGGQFHNIQNTLTNIGTQIPYTDDNYDSVIDHVRDESKIYYDNKDKRAYNDTCFTV